MIALIFYAVLCAALFYLGSRALITRPLWSRYPPRMGKLMDCAACSGFWYGALLEAFVGPALKLDVMGMPHSPLTAIVVALCMLVLTPITAGLMQWGLDQLGVAQ